MKLSHFSKNIWRTTVLAALSVLMVGCGSDLSLGVATPTPITSATSAGTITIVSSLPRRGGNKDKTDSLVNSIKQALDESGNQTISGYTIKYEDKDDSDDTGAVSESLEVANANAAAADPSVMIYIGTFNSGVAKASIPILNKAGIMMISPANSYPGLTKTVAGLTAADEPAKYYPTGKRNYFRIFPTDDYQGPADALFMVSPKAPANASTTNSTTTYGLGLSKVFVVDDNQTYGKGLAEAFVGGAKIDNLTIGGRVTITTPTQDVGPIVSQIRDAGVDGVFYGGDPENGGKNLLLAMRDAGINIPFVGGDSVASDQFAKDLGSKAGQVYASIGGTSFDVLPPKGRTWLVNYRAKFQLQQNQNPNPNAIQGYEVASVALYLLNRTAIDPKNDSAGSRDRIIKGAATISPANPFDGVLGKWSFDNNGDISLRQFAIYSIQNNVFTFFQEVQAP